MLRRCRQLPSEAATFLIFNSEEENDSEHHAEWRIKNKRCGEPPTVGTLVTQAMTRAVEKKKGKHNETKMQ